jgi:hypothetical protein
MKDEIDKTKKIIQHEQDKLKIKQDQIVKKEERKKSSHRKKGGSSSK